MSNRQDHALIGYCLASALAASQAHAGAFRNGDFSPDFAPWQGEIENADFDIAAADPDSDARFALPGGGTARISTDPGPDPIGNPAANIIAVNLFQTFDLPHWAQTLGFDYGWSMSNPDVDYVDAALFSVADPLLFVDLFAAVDTLLPSASGRLAVDIPALAGMGAQLRFRVADGGDDVADWLRIGNIRVIPAPGTPVLIGLGLLALAGLASTRRRARH